MSVNNVGFSFIFNSLFEKLFIAYGNTDEIFAVSVSNEGEVGTRYMAGLILLPVLGWTGGTLVGAITGNILPAIPPIERHAESDARSFTSFEMSESKEP